MMASVSSGSLVQKTPPSSQCSMMTDDDKPFVTPESSNGKETFSDGGGDTVKDPGENDVLCGRGGSINSHPGNERFRQLVEKRKRVYLTARFKREKRLIASSIVSEIRSLDPPGRFLSRDAKLGVWRDIGDEKARDKTSQALRENAPSIRAEIETEINEQRAEMQRAEEEEAAARATAARQQPPPPASHPYFSQGWGYHSYYGYSHHAQHPPAPHGPPPPGHPQPPGYHPPYEGGQWAGGNGPFPPQFVGGPPEPYAAAQQQATPPPLPTTQPTPLLQAQQQHQQPQPQQRRSSDKSVLEQTADIVTSGAESLKTWTRQSLSFRSVNSAPSMDGHDAKSVGSHSLGTISTKPIVYVHQDEAGKKRRIVKFRDEGGRYHRKRPARPTYSPIHSNNSVLDTLDGEPDEDEVEDIEPQNLDTANDHSLMTQVANQILGSIGSWDTGTVLCGREDADEPVPFPHGAGGQARGAASSHPNRRGADAPEVTWEDDMAVEWEGQEVLLVDKKNNNEQDSVASNERMPPPVVRPRPVPDQASSLGGFSSLGSCHSWMQMPEQFSSAASLFTGSYVNPRQGATGVGGVPQGGVSPAGSMEMEYSTENFSVGGSLGGGSLTRVFENEVHPEPPTYAMPSPNMNPRTLNRIPSWDRSFRSRSPISAAGGGAGGVGGGVGAGGGGSLSGDDESLISKTDSKVSDGGAAGGRPQQNGNDMQWETKE